MTGKTAASIQEDVEGRLLAIRARLLESYDRACTEDLGLDDLDSEVVCDQLDIAVERTELALLALHPELSDVDDVAAAGAFGELCARHVTERQRPREDPREDIEFVALLISLSAAGLMQMVRGWRRRAVAEAIADEMAIVSEVMAFIAYVLNPDDSGAHADELEPDERVRLASRLEQYELLLDEARTGARRRLECSLGGSAN